MSKTSPGPWKYEPFEEFLLVGPDGKPLLQYDWDHNVEFVNGADARLCAAAPELLAFCQWFAEQMAGVSPVHPNLAKMYDVLKRIEEG